MKRLLLTLLFAFSAQAQTLNLHLTMGPSLPMGGYQLNGTVRPPAVGYQIGINAFDVNATINGAVSTYKVSVNAVTFFGLNGALSAGLTPCVARLGSLSLCAGPGVDLFNGPEGRSVFQRFSWQQSFFFVTTASLPLPDFGAQATPLGAFAQPAPITVQSANQLPVKTVSP